MYSSVEGQVGIPMSLEDLKQRGRKPSQEGCLAFYVLLQLFRTLYEDVHHNIVLFSLCKMRKSLEFQQFRA